MAPRANWKGYLKLSLVSCPVALFPASSTSSRISFNTLNKKTRNKVKRVYVDPDTGDEVPSEDQVKGYAIGKHDYLVVEDTELDAVQIESNHTIDIQSFVPRDEIDPRYIDTPYYIAPDAAVAHEAFAVIREAMRKAKKVGLGRVVISRRERIVMIEPWKKGLLATLLRYGYEVRGEEPYFADIPDVPITGEMRDLANLIIERKTARFEPSAFEDRYENALIELMKTKQAGQPAPARAVSRPTNIVDLVEALRKSVAAVRATAPDVPVLDAQPKPALSSKGRRKAGEEAPILVPGKGPEAVKKPSRARS